MPHVILPRFAAVVLVCAISCPTARSDERNVADILPPTTLAFAEVRRPAELLKEAYAHPLAERLLALEPVRAAMAKKEFLDHKAVVAIVESQMGLAWQEIAAQTAGIGLTLAVDGKTGGVIVLAEAENGATQAKLLEVLARLAALDAKNKGQAEPAQAAQYRGVAVYAVDKSKVAAASKWLAATDNEELGRQVIDRIVDRSGDSLAADARFAAARRRVSPSATAWGYLNLAAVRDGEDGGKLAAGRADNIVGELLLGGVLNTLQNATYATFELTASRGELRLSAAAPHDRQWAGDLREHYFGPQGTGAAPPPLAVEGGLLSLGAYRDISAMWLRAGDLLSEAENEKMAQADSNLSTLFSGKDFGEDILGAFKPEVRLVVARREFDAGQPAPAIRLPAFAFVADLKDPAQMRPELRRTFQSLIGFFNVVGAMNGQPQLDLAMEKTSDGELISANYLPPADGEDPQRLPINYNFSPSIAFAKERFVLASTQELAQALATAGPAPLPTGEKERVVNLQATLRAETLNALMADNREQLIAQNMLKEGHDRQEAEAAVALLLEAISWFDEVALRLDTTGDEMKATLDVSLKGRP